MANVQTPRRGGRTLFGGRAIGQRPGKPATTMGGMPAGRQGMVGTAGNPSPSVPGVTTGMKRSPPTPNSGGTIQGRGQTITLPTDPGYKGPAPTGFGAKPDTPQAWRGPTRPPGGADAGPASIDLDNPASTNRPQQTERANPLVNGGGTPQLEGTSVPVAAPAIDAGKAMGYSQRGNRMPGGKDRMVGTPGPDVGAFDKPDTSSLMGDHVRDLYEGVKATAPTSGLSRVKQKGVSDDLADSRESVEDDMKG